MKEEKEEDERCPGDDRKVGGAIMVVIGLALLSGTTGFLPWGISWPFILIGIGFVLLLSSRRIC
jgi:hypothetical protein